MYTGVEEPKLVAQLYSLGVDDVCFKPISPDLLALKINAVFHKWIEQMVKKHSQSPLQKNMNQPVRQTRFKQTRRANRRRSSNWLQLVSVHPDLTRLNCSKPHLRVFLAHTAVGFFSFSGKYGWTLVIESRTESVF